MITFTEIHHPIETKFSEDLAYKYGLTNHKRQKCLEILLDLKQQFELESMEAYVTLDSILDKIL